MKKTYWILFFVVALLIVAAVPAFAAGPNFGEAIYADGRAWGTKGNSQLPPPNGHNDQSFDGLFIFGDDAVDGQLAVAEAAPGNTAYNGGRWAVYDVTWNVGPELVTSYAQLMDLESDGAVTIVAAHQYFQCPLLPVKN